MYAPFMAQFRFHEPENLGVFVCDNVRLRGMPVLHVSHDEEGDWQFLCGGEHGDGGDDGAALVCLKEMVAGDESLNELAELCRLQEAHRDGPNTPWRIDDRMEDIIRHNVAEHACHVMVVEGDGDAQRFAYSIGLTRTHKHPELVCFGLREEVLHWIINEISDRMASGEQFKDGDRVAGLIEGYDCVLKRMQRGTYRQYLGYALWFYQGDEFEALQIVWPDMQGRYPWDPGYTAPRNQQPSTW
jgi:hypothetical protein